MSRRPIFINEHLEGFYGAVRSAREKAEVDLENAQLKEVIVGLLSAGGHALHAMFEAGGEPKWRHPSERESLIELSDALHDAFAKISEAA
ncbi:hypothetical protein [Rhizobium rhizogenes]|uniref:hypothetical protein n=1 Tax=Rhizobium rhizogenes TaxID=359 RepID=UPI0015729F33|nr:hypothetical protein [Rhizobium rhizogenes]NTG07207.1 hypothetical protein [Rhizobium rhizogenes]